MQKLLGQNILFSVSGIARYDGHLFEGQVHAVTRDGKYVAIGNGWFPAANVQVLTGLTDETVEQSVELKQTKAMQVAAILAQQQAAAPLVGGLGTGESAGPKVVELPKARGKKAKAVADEPKVAAVQVPDPAEDLAAPAGAPAEAPSTPTEN